MMNESHGVYLSSLTPPSLDTSHREYMSKQNNIVSPPIKKENGGQDKTYAKRLKTKLKSHKRKNDSIQGSVSPCGGGGAAAVFAKAEGAGERDRTSVTQVRC